MITNIDIVNEELSMKLKMEGETGIGEATSSISPSVQESSIGNSMLEEEQTESDSGSDHQTGTDSALEILRFPMTKNEAFALLRSNVVAVQTLEHITEQLNRTMEEIKEERKSFREEREFYVEERRVLQEQMRDMSLKLLKAELTTNKESQSLRLNYQLPNGTPKKLERLPLTETTPKPTNADDNNRHSFPRRALSYLKSRDLFAERSDDEDCSSPPQQADSIQAPVPKLTLVDVKQDISNNSSPLRNGLLALANAALKCTYADEKSSLSPKSDSTSTTDDDSGRSSEGSSGDSSPPAGMMASEKFVRYEVLNSSFPHHQHPHNDLRLIKHAFVSRSELEMKARKRRKDKEPLPCNFCGKCFNNQSSLRQHESFHKPVRPFKCASENCDKAYKTRSELNRHKIVHDGEKRHECKLCGKRFLRKQYLKTHLLRHHETGLALLMPSAMENFKNDTTGSIPSIVVSSSFVSKTEPLTWRCQMCFKIFVNEEDLSSHVRSYHERKRLSEVRYDFHSHHDRTEMMETPSVLVSEF